MVIRLWSCRINGYDLTVGEEFSGSPAGDSFPGSDFMTAAIVLICSPPQSAPNNLRLLHLTLSYLDLTLALTGILFTTTLCTGD